MSAVKSDIKRQIPKFIQLSSPVHPTHKTAGTLGINKIKVKRLR